MDVNSINNSINSLNNSASLQVDKSSKSKQVGKLNEDGLTLSIKEYNNKRDELSLNVQALNNGIAITKISTNAIDNQKVYIENIQEKMSNIENYQDKNDIKAEINQELRSYNQIAYGTKFKNENLLVTNRYEDNPVIEVNTSNAYFSVEKPNTAQYSSDIFEAVNNYDLNKNENLNASIDTISSSYGKLQNNYEQFAQLGSDLEVNARDTIKEQQNLYTNNVLSKQRNYGDESSNFSKSNVSANSGYFVASQSNIVQEQTVRLLS